MDAYVLGTHRGDLPTDLVGSGAAGNRVRAVARLQSPSHDVFYALEGESREDIDRHLAAIGAAGTSADQVLQVDESWAAAILVPLPPKPAWLPPGLAIAFLHVVGEGAEQAVAALQKRLGDNAVAIVKLEDGSYLVEAVGDDLGELTGTLDDAFAADTVSEQVRAFTTADDLHRAT